MFLAEILELLQGEGLPATAAKIRHGILTGRIAQPPFNSVGFRIYSDCHVAQFRRYLENPPSSGRRSRRERLAAERKTCVVEA